MRSKGLEEYEFGENTFFFLPANQLSSHKNYSPDAKGYYCFFHEDLLHSNLLQPAIVDQFSFLKFNGNPLVKVDKKSVKNIVFILKRLEKELAKDVIDNAILKSYLFTLFFELKPFCKDSELLINNAAVQITQRYKNALSKYIYEKHLVSDYANLLSISSDYLNRCVKKTVGKSAHELLSDMMLLESKFLLRQTPMPVSEIGYKIGKESPSDFARFFKNKTKLTPTEYREKV